MSKLLEPLYLNEKMLLNCAAHLYGGVALESEVKETTGSKSAGGGKVGLEFLKGLLSPVSFHGSIEKSTDHEEKTSRRFTLGGLHMSVLERLESEELITTIDRSGFESLNSDELSYVNLRGLLKPTDLFSILGTVRTIAPMVFQLLRDFGDRFAKPGNNTKERQLQTKVFTQSVEKYEKYILSVTDKLETDYLNSRQLEMVLYEGEQPIGIVDLDLQDNDATAIKAKLTGARVHVIGKISDIVPLHGSMSLMQRTSLSGAVDLVEKFAAIQTNVESLVKYYKNVERARTVIEQFCRLSIEGPAVRVVAMSVCV